MYGAHPSNTKHVPSGMPGLMPTVSSRCSACTSVPLAATRLRSKCTCSHRHHQTRLKQRNESLCHALSILASRVRWAQSFNCIRGPVAPVVHVPQCASRRECAFQGPSGGSDVRTFLRQPACSSSRVTGSRCTCLRPGFCVVCALSDWNAIARSACAAHLTCKHISQNHRQRFPCNHTS